MAKEPWEQEQPDDWEPSPEFWQIEIFGCDGYFQVDNATMRTIQSQLSAGLGGLIKAVDTLGREFIFPADKFACTCWCTPQTRDRIRLAEIERNREEASRVERIGPEDRVW